MAKHVAAVVCLLAVLLAWPGPALPQTPSPEALAAAREFVVAAKMADQVANTFPLILQQLKPLMTRGNPLAERDFDALMPFVVKAMDKHIEGLLNASALIYARHFTIDEIRQLTTLYRTPVMEKFLQQQPEVLKENMALGQQFGQAVGRDLEDKIREELRKRGHDI